MVLEQLRTFQNDFDPERENISQALVEENLEQCHRYRHFQSTCSPVSSWVDCLKGCTSPVPSSANQDNEGNVFFIMCANRISKHYDNGTRLYRLQIVRLAIVTAAMDRVHLWNFSIHMLPFVNVVADFKGDVWNIENCLQSSRCFILSTFFVPYFFKRSFFKHISGSSLLAISIMTIIAATGSLIAVFAVRFIENALYFPSPHYALATILALLLIRSVTVCCTPCEDWIKYWQKYSYYWTKESAWTFAFVQAAGSVHEEILYWPQLLSI